MAEHLLLGERLSHSYSPEIHALLGEYRYELMELRPEEVDDFICARGFRGANVTIPYKVRALALCDRLSNEARALQNVNTLVVESDGSLSGHNTDLFGLLYMIRRSGIGIAGQKVAILGGNGGAGRTAEAAIRQLGAREVICVSRAGPVDYDALYRDHADVEVLINATPVGMYPNCGASPVDLDLLPHVCGVLDLIYNPHRTALMLSAQARGIRSENGLSMLVAQAARAKELFTGEPVREGLVEEIILALSRRQLNLVLIGMPGSGKTSIGRAAAEIMGREFVDADIEIERRAGMPIPEIFALHGEPHFRALESAVIADLGARGSLVIATGGGAVLRDENVRALRQNGALALVDRPVDALAMDGRPLSSGADALRQMAAIRAPLYRAACQFIIHNETTIDDAARAAKEGFDEAAGD